MQDSRAVVRLAVQGVKPPSEFTYACYTDRRGESSVW